MMTPQEIQEASKAIARMRPQPTNKRLPRELKALLVDHILAGRQLAKLESGEDVEVPSYKLTEANRIQYNDSSIYGARSGKQNSPWRDSGYFFK